MASDQDDDLFIDGRRKQKLAVRILQKRIDHQILMKLHWRMTMMILNLPLHMDERKRKERKEVKLAKGKVRKETRRRSGLQTVPKREVTLQRKNPKKLNPKERFKPLPEVAHLKPNQPQSLAVTCRLYPKCAILSI